MCAIGVTSESKTLEPFYDIVCCCLDAHDFLAPSDGDNGNSGNKQRRKRKRREREREKRKKARKKGRKSLARASCLKWFGERWHAKLESSVSPSPLWLHIKRNREKFFPTKINGAGLRRGPLTTQITLSACFQNLLGFQAVWLKFCWFVSDAGTWNFPTIHFQLFKRGKKTLQSSLGRSKNRSLAKNTYKQKIYTKLLLYTKGKISEMASGFFHCTLS